MKKSRFLSECFSFHSSKTFMVMRITIFLILITVFESFAHDSYSQKTILSLSFEDKRLEEALDEIEQVSEFFFLYSEKLVDTDRIVSVKVKDAKINDVLDDLFANTDVTYTIMDRKILLAPDYLSEVQEVSHKVSGVIKDKSGDPLPGVTVIVKGTTNGIITDMDGNYSLDGISPTDVLVYSFVGMVSQEITVGEQTVINVVLEDSTIGLDEVIAVGYGKQSKRAITGSIQSVDAEELTDMPVSSVTQKLQGKLAGVQINQTTGKPGGGMQVRIRGQASLTAGNEPLYVVDGFPISGDISSINPNEIESISVLKDASSTALYGSRAANGVILVTTKRAKPGKTTIGFSGYYGVQQVPNERRPDMMNATEFAQFKKESFEDLGLEVPEAFQNPEQYGEGYNFYDAILRNAPIQEYNLNLSTSKENFSTTAVVGLLNQDGVVLNSDYNRFSLRINSEFQITDKISAGVKIAPTISTSNSPDTDGQFWAGGIVNNSLLTWPIFPYRNEDGTMPLMSWDPAISAFPTPNYYRAVQEITNKNKQSRVISNAFLQYEPISGLVLKTTYNLDYAYTKFENINPSTASSGFIVVLPTTSSAVFRNTHSSSWLNENTATYTKSFNGHNLEALGGFTIQKFDSDLLQLRVTGFPDDRVPTVGAAANIDRAPDQFGNRSTYNDIQEWSMMSYIGRVNYNYKNRYLFSAAIRADGSSRFGEDNRWGTFPSVSGGWIVSEEGFMKDLKKLSLFKLRASYGIVGNNNIGNYTQYATVSSGESGFNSIFGSELASGAAVTQLPNSELTWEQTAEYDLGFDIGLFNNNLNIGYDYYNRKSKSLLYSVNVAQESGFSFFNGNIGELQF